MCVTSSEASSTTGIPSQLDVTNYKYIIMQSKTDLNLDRDGKTSTHRNIVLRYGLNMKVRF